MPQNASPPRVPHVDDQNHTRVPGDGRIEPREITKGGDDFLATSVTVVVATALFVGAGLGMLAALIYEIFDPFDVDTPTMVISGAIAGAVLGGMVAARQIVGRFDQK
jgi:hypothetical protein